ncbi:uncharacterized protein [Oscarella lobularis]|uniref:uncharacterized protein n=1 Tax=Oscarella lobularis TaxID=121494 RepID=UPI003313D795
MTTREQKLVFLLASNVVAKRLPLQTNAFVETLRRRGVPALELEERASEGDEIETRLRETTKMLKALHASLSATNDKRKDLFAIFCSTLQAHNPRVWQECMCSLTKLTNEELESVCVTEEVSHPFRTFLRDGEIKTVLQAILRAQKDVTQLQKLRRCVNLSRRSYVPVAGCLDCKPLLWSILNNRKDVAHLRNLAPTMQKFMHSSNQSAFDRRLYEFCCEEIGQYWLPLGLRLGLSRDELRAIGDEFNSYGDNYKALAVMRGYITSNDEAVFDKIRVILEEIKQSSDTCARETNQQIIRSNVPRTNKRFYGRLSEMKEMERFFWGSRARESHVTPISHKLQFICGVGGVGKTSLALQYIARHERAYPHGVVCIDSQSVITIEASLQEYFVRATKRGDGNFEEVKEEKSLQRLFAYFYEHVKQNRRVLILFDNADDLELIAKYLPHPSTSCHVLITTRTTQSCELFREDNSNVLVLETLEESIAISALIGLAGKEKETLSPSELKAARKIAVEAPIEGLPIALRHAGAYLLRHEGVTFEAYWEKLVQEKRQLEAASLDLDKFLRYFRLSHLEEDLHRVGIKIPNDLLRFKIDDIKDIYDRQSLANAVKKLHTTRHAFLTWEMDISDIEEKYPVAFSILLCCSVMMSKSISQEVISKFLSLVHGNFESLRLVEGLVSLKKYTLLNRDEFNDGCVYYSMHHLIHQSIFERLRRNKELLESVLDDTAHALVDVIKNTEGEVSSATSLHYYSVAKNMVVLGRLGSLDIAHIRNAATCCYRCGQFNAFEELALIMISSVTNRPDFSERKKIKILRPYHLKLSNLASLRGDAFEAEEHYEKAFIGRKFLTNDDDDDYDDDDDDDYGTDVDDVKDFLFALMCGGRLEKEAELNYLVSRLEKIVQVDETHLQNLRWAYTQLGAVLLKSGQRKKYEDHVKFLLSLSSSRSDPAKAVTGLVCLGFCKYREGMFDEAIEYFSQVINASNSFFLFPYEVEEIRVHLFTCCARSGNFELGHQVLKEGLPIVQAHCDSEDLLSVAYNAAYGYSLCLLKKFTEAVSHLRYCLAVCPRSKESETVLLRIVSYLGTSLVAVEKLDETIQILNEFDGLFKKHMNDPIWLCSPDFDLLPKLYIATEKWDGAICLLDGFLDFYKTQELPLSYNSLKATGLLARCLLNNGLANEAYTVASKAISEYESFSDYGLLEAIGSILCDAADDLSSLAASGSSWWHN